MTGMLDCYVLKEGGIKKVKWEFEQYGEKSVERDSSSDKFFKESTESDSLIREFIQNSLDARANNKPVKVIIRKRTLGQNFFHSFLSSLKPHLKAVGVSVPDGKINVIVLEDFNTKGLEGKNQQDFFYKDNITSKTEGGGSHGIGKAVFHSSSSIKSFFGYSVFENNKSVCVGRSVLKSHRLNNSFDTFRPDGRLEINTKEHTNFITELFMRKQNEKGLSVAIPYCDIELNDIKNSCLRQFYKPIMNKELEVIVNDEKINYDVLFDYIGKETEKPLEAKIKLIWEYKTAKSKTYKISEKNWKQSRFPQLKEEELKAQDQIFLIKCEIEIPFKKLPQTKKYGSVILLIKKSVEDSQDQIIDCWRDNLLITKALGYEKKEREYSVILLIDNNPLSELLRKLEDPGHTKWQTGQMKEDIKAEYKNIQSLVKFIKKLPLEIIRQIKHQPIEQDSKFFADYFPESSYEEKKDITAEVNGESNVRGGTNDIADMEPSFQDFNYKKHKKGDGFRLTLKNKTDYPDKVIVKTAYGTNIGNAFKNYDERDFEFGKDIKITANNGEQISSKKNSAQYSINNGKFSLAFSGFDPDKELRIEVK